MEISKNRKCESKFERIQLGYLNIRLDYRFKIFGPSEWQSLCHKWSILDSEMWELWRENLKFIIFFKIDDFPRISSGNHRWSQILSLITDIESVSLLPRWRKAWYFDESVISNHKLLSVWFACQYKLRVADSMLYNGSPSINIDITSALFTLGTNYDNALTQCFDCASDVDVNCRTFITFW